jgi:[ribosomal protein S5]-alanine N-acetyltransferase
MKSAGFKLRFFRPSDAENLAKNISNKKIIDNLRLSIYPYTLKNMSTWLKKKIPEYRKKAPTSFSLAIDIGGEAVGSIGFGNIIVGHKASLGYWLAEKYWGQGIMTQAVKEAVKYGEKKYKLKRIYASVYMHNLASKKVLLKNDFKQEGILRKEVKKYNKLVDCYLLAKVKK